MPAGILFSVLGWFASHLILLTLAGFVAEFQIFAGTFSVYPWLAAIALSGILITAALFLSMIQQIFFGALPKRRAAFPDLDRSETAILGALLALVVLIGLYPRWLLDLVNAGASAIVGAR